MVDAANLFAGKGLRVTLILLAPTAGSFYPIKPNVTIIQRDIDFGITEKGNPVSRKIKMISNLAALKKIIKRLRADVLICTEYPFAVAAVLCSAKKYSKLVSWEHTHFSINFKNRFWATLCKITYPKLDVIVCLNPDEKKLFGHLNKNVVVIPNFIPLSTRNSDLQNQTILTIARLTAVKGIDHLLETAKLVLKEHADWKWKLIGEGELKYKAEDFIERENLKDKLLLQAPSNPDIATEYQNASMYVMTSLNECFPMVLLEALSYGLPCISFDCDTGPRHIIQNNVDGLLVEKENPQAMTNAINKLIGDDAKRKAMGANAIENSKRFSAETVYQLWERLFNDDKR